MKVGLKSSVAAGVVLLLGGAALAGRSKPVEESAAPELAVVQLRDLDVRAEAAGVIEPIRVVEVKSKASGEVLAMHVETGDVVERGALLAEVDPRDVQNALDQAEADLEVARVRAETAEAQRRRVEELRRSNVVTQQEYESAVEAAANAQAALVRARTNLQLARERRGDVTIRAPITGTVIERSVEPGGIITSATSHMSGGTTLLRMADLAEMQVRTLVDETDIGQVRPGLPARVTVEAFPNRTFRGEVLKIEPQAVIEQNVTMFPVLVRLDNREGLLKPGMNAEVAVEIAQRQDVLTIPNAAVVGMRDARTTAEALGLGEDALTAAMRPAATPPPAQPGAAPAQQVGAPGATGECAALRERIQGGGWQGLSEADRAKLRECRQQFGGGRAGRDGAGPGARGGEARPGIVFVQGANGIEPRRVRLGLNDWDYSEVVEGLKEGEQVVLVTVARMQAQQQEFTNRIRERTSGPIPGGGRRGGGR